MASKKPQIDPEVILKASKNKKEPTPQRKGEDGTVYTANSPIEEINYLHQEITSLIHNAVMKGIRIGEVLSAIKEELKHGEFTDFVESNCNFKPRMARNYMRLYQYRDTIKSSLENHEAMGLKEALALANENQNGKEEPKTATGCRFESEYESFLAETKAINQQIRSLQKKPEPDKKEINQLKEDLKQLIDLLNAISREL